jgi:hypothetical protein
VLPIASRRAMPSGHTRAQRRSCGWLPTGDTSGEAADAGGVAKTTMLQILRPEGAHIRPVTAGSAGW